MSTKCFQDEKAYKTYITCEQLAQKREGEGRDWRLSELVETKKRGGTHGASRKRRGTYQALQGWLFL